MFKALTNAYINGLRQQTLIMDDEIIAWIGHDVDARLQECESIEDCQGRLVTAGLIDCHTHLIYGGKRFDEYEARLNGSSYEEIAKKGGGILSTVKATRDCTEQKLFESASKRLLQLISDGVTAIEIKSGYGLDLETELKMLKVAAKLEQVLGLKISKTFLGAHTIPPEYKDNRQAYVDLICETVLPEVKPCADACDIFCESIAFTLKESKQILQTAKDLGLNLKAHAEQLSATGAAAMASQMGALSVEHLEYLDEISVKILAENNTVGVLLPGAFYTLKEIKKPPIDLFRKYHVPIAIASDSNPGSSPVLSLRLMMNMACQLFGLTPEESLKAVTINAAQALGLNDLGKLQKGYKANIAIWDAESVAELCGTLGGSLLNKSYSYSKLLFES